MDGKSNGQNRHALQNAFITTDSDARNPSGLLSPPSSVSSDLSIELSDKRPDMTERLDLMAGACKTLLECLGEDPSREGLVKTPMRMAKALLACTAGYAEDAKSVISGALFTCSSDEMVIVRDIDCFSMCEHHMLPFFGKVHIAYIPRGKVLGLSKFARVVDIFAKRLQIQEQLTSQIANALQEHVDAAGVAVFTDMTHMCMSMRGVEKPGATTVSTAFTGAFKTDASLRSQFFEVLQTAHTVARSTRS